MEKELEEIKAIEEMTTEEDTDENNNENRKFYVYEHIRLDNNTCFYVGKGKGDRAYDLDRGNFHNGVRDEYGCRVEIIKDGLTEEEAFKLETERIEDYVITFGYGISIDGYRDFSNNKYLTNFTWGGEGCSGYKHSEEEKQKMSKSLKGKNKGKHHSEEHNKKVSKSLEGKHHSEEARKKMSEKASIKVICITTGKIFNSQKEANNYYKCGGISLCCEGIRKSVGKLSDGTKLQWKFLKDYDNDFKGILINPITE